MTVNATFVGDFSKFETAVEGAVLKLKGIESGAATAEKTLNRMADNFTGRKLIADATLMIEAVERIGGTSKLTTAELAKLGAMANDAATKMRLMGEAVPPKMQALADSTKVANTWMNNLGTSVVATAAGFVSAQAAISLATGAFRTFSDFVGDSVKAFGEAERAQARLVASLRAQGEATPAVITQMNALATQFQQTTVYGDDLINEMESLLTTVGKVLPKDMERALEASTNLAAGLGIDLREATEKVARAAAGHSEALGKLGISFETTGDKGKDLDRVLNGINAQFGGQAAAQLETYDGKVKQIGNSWNNVQENVGKLLTTTPLAKVGLDAIAEAITHVDTESGKMTVSFADLADVLMGKDVAAFVAYVEALARGEEKTDTFTGATHAANEELQATAASAKFATDQLKSLNDQHDKAVADAIKRYADLTKKLDEIQGKTEAGLLGLSKAEQQETQRAMENTVAKYAQIDAHNKLIASILAEAEAAKKANAAAIGGPTDPIQAAAQTRDAAMARANQAFPQGGENAAAIYEGAARDFQAAVDKATAGVQPRGFNAGQVPFSQLTPNVNITVNGVLDPRTINDLSTAVGQRLMQQSGRQFGAR